MEALWSNRFGVAGPWAVYPGYDIGAKLEPELSRYDYNQVRISTIHPSR